nr:FHIPEP family type III secretion protein [Methylocucumis oryzae]
MDMTKIMSGLKFLAKAELGAPLVVILILAMIMLPLPPFVLDFLFTFNIAFSLIILLVVVYTLKPLEFAAFPSVILLATLLRLALKRGVYAYCVVEWT